MAEQTLVWRQCMDASESPAWCALEKVDTSTITASQGVYVIWHGGDEPDTVRVGQAFFGTIGETIERCRTDPDILGYRDLGLYVTWAEVADETILDGIERHLGDLLQPLLGRRPAAEPVAVNLPWGESEGETQTDAGANA